MGLWFLAAFEVLYSETKLSLFKASLTCSCVQRGGSERQLQRSCRSSPGLGSVFWSWTCVFSPSGPPEGRECFCFLCEPLERSFLLISAGFYSPAPPEVDDLSSFQTLLRFCCGALPPHWAWTRRKIMKRVFVGLTQRTSLPVAPSLSFCLQCGSGDSLQCGPRRWPQQSRSDTDTDCSLASASIWSLQKNKNKD